MWPQEAGLVHLGHVTRLACFLLLLIVVVKLPDGPRHNDGERNTCEEKQGKVTLRNSRQRPWCFF